MSENIKNQLRELLLISSAFNTNDVLVHCDVNDNKVWKYHDEISTSLETFPKRILRETQRSIRETGVNPLCIAKGIVLLSVNGKNVNTPLFLFPANLAINKMKGLVEFSQEEEPLINPFLSRFLEREYSIKLEEETCLETLKSSGFTLNELPSFLGNFHHHRFEIVRELEELLNSDGYSSAMKSIFGEEKNLTYESVKFHPGTLFPSDSDQEQVFNRIVESNLAIQGPPGTGKSHVLTNLSAKLLHSEKKFVIVSEKFVALEVIQKKLAEFGLDQFAFIAAGNTINHDFNSALKLSWDALENRNSFAINNLMLSQQYEAHLQLILDLLNVPDLVGGMSFVEFNELLKKYGRKENEYSSEIPDLQEFCSNLSVVSELYELKLATAVSKLRLRTIALKDFNHLDERLRDIHGELKLIKTHFDFNTWSDYWGVMKMASKAQVFENDLYKEFSKIFHPNTRERKRFMSLYKKYRAGKRSISSFETETHWITPPDLLETQELLAMLDKKTWLGKMAFNRRWSKHTKLSAKSAKEALTSNLNKLETNALISQIEVKFCELGVQNPEIQADIIYHSIIQQSDEEWVTFMNLDPNQRQLLTEHHAQIHVVYEFLKDVLFLNNDDPLISEIENIISCFGNIVAIHEKIAKLSTSNLKTISRNKDFNSYRSQVLYSHQVQFKEQFPQLSEFSIQELGKIIDNVIIEQAEESRLLALEIKNKQKDKFDFYNTLLNTPAKKLSDSEKQTKSILKKGKSILVKEFSKTRRFSSPRELYKSEAKPWLELLVPIWLTNPSQLSNCFPMEPLFDFAIFDEASQIPLQNGLGAIQRSERVVVAGDEQQMSPTSYFQTTGSDIIDLLHQANFYYDRITLKHHYRSEHPDLIAFSNKHFYKNELQVYPAYNRNSKPLRHIYIENGVFADRKNEVEAKALAELISSNINHKNTLGVVAFSEEQLNAIWTQLDLNTKTTLEERVSNGSAFFKSLENVQGDECDDLYISFGYGANMDGDFNMRFGPMNTSNGRKRLNVLLTRSIKSLTFMTSVKSEEFKLSDNESIELLRKWFQFSENVNTDHELCFPFALNPEVNTNGIKFVNVHQTLGNARELVTLHRALSNRNWVIQYE